MVSPLAAGYRPSRDELSPRRIGSGNTHDDAVDRLLGGGVQWHTGPPIRAVILAGWASPASSVCSWPRRSASGRSLAAATFVGTWLTTIIPRGRAPLPSLTTYGADGTLIVSRPPVSPATTGGTTPPIFMSAGQGVWAWTGARTIAIVVVFLQTDEQGHALGSQTIRGTDQLAQDGQTFSGTGTLVVSDSQGHVTATSTVTARGTRLMLSAPSHR